MTCRGVYCTPPLWVWSVLEFLDWWLEKFSVTIYLSISFTKILFWNCACLLDFLNIVYTSDLSYFCHSPFISLWFLGIFSFCCCSAAKLCLTLCNPMGCSMPGFSVLREVAQTHDHWVGDAIQPSHPLSSSFPPTLNLSQHQGLFQQVSSSYQVAKYWSFHTFQWIFRVDFL